MQKDVIRVDDNYYILATSSRLSEETRTLKHEESFAIFNAYGDIELVGLKEQGLYYQGTRHLSYYKMNISETNPMLLSSTVKEDNSLFTVDLANIDITENGTLTVPKGSIHILRRKFLFKNTCYEKITIRNFSLTPKKLHINIAYASDFADMFEIRGVKRDTRGTILKPKVYDCKIVFAYIGKDGRLRQTTIAFSPTPQEVSPNEVAFYLSLEPKKEYIIHTTITCSTNVEETTIPLRKAFSGVVHHFKQWTKSGCMVHTSNEQFNRWIRRCLADIAMLMTKTPHGFYPYAGIPWFNAPFGRDGIITALQTLWIKPEIAKGVLSFLSATQSKGINERQDAQPGKIIHEIRRGEMAEAGEIPFTKYYGSIDATPLFVVLAGEYYSRTGDTHFIKQIWENIMSAVKWIDTYGDKDGDGLVEYTASKDGLTNKGWKDSHDSVFHADGTLATDPIALVEVQGYVYQAKKEAAKIADALGHKELSAKWLQEAQRIKQQIDDLFWCEELSFYGMALDGNKKLCRVKTSNAGHLLFSNAAKPSRAKRIAKLLFERAFFSGWGIRTVSSDEVQYNPLSYHNGSIWPHDNAIIAYGLAKYGFKEEALRILKGLFEASTFFDLHRLPELFCGFYRRPNEGPTHYPVACNPQAWAAGTVFMLLQAVLGLSVGKSEVRFTHPLLPEFLNEVWIKNLQTSEGSVNLHLRRYERDVVVNVTRKDGNVRIIIEK